MIISCSIMSTTEDNRWIEEMKESASDEASLKALLGDELPDTASAWFDNINSLQIDNGLPYLPVLMTRQCAANAAAAGPACSSAGNNPVLRQFIPDAAEFDRKSCELEDPLGEKRFNPCPRLVHRYPDRVLMLVTDQCAAYCRYCFRRNFSGGMKGPIRRNELEAIAGYLAVHSEVKELLLSGGDPLTLSDRRLFELLNLLKETRPDLIIRICSRMPVVLPSRITPSLTEMLSGFRGLWMVTHINHPAEISVEFEQAVKRLMAAGIPSLSQTVLLRGVNDAPETLAELFTGLMLAGVKPYYLLQGDLAAGTSHMRVTMREGLEIARRLKLMVSGAVMPKYAVDLPGGGGKVILPQDAPPRLENDGCYHFKGLDNEEYRYPAD